MPTITPRADEAKPRRPRRVQVNARPARAVATTDAVDVLPGRGLRVATAATRAAKTATAAKTVVRPKPVGPRLPIAIAAPLPPGSANVPAQTTSDARALASTTVPGEATVAVPETYATAASVLAKRRTGAVTPRSIPDRDPRPPDRAQRRRTGSASEAGPALRTPLVGAGQVPRPTVLLTATTQRSTKPVVPNVPAVLEGRLAALSIVGDLDIPRVYSLNGRLD